jgi:hypothetical protein
MGVWLDAYVARRTASRWWDKVQAFTISDAACLLSDVKRSDFQKSDRAVAIANELRGFINSGQVPLFLEMEYEKALPDFSDPNARYEPPYGKKDVGFDAVIARTVVEGIARGKKWPLPWPIPPKDENERGIGGHILPRPKPLPPKPRLADLVPMENYLPKLGDFMKKDEGQK